MYVSERETETVPMEESSSLQLSELASIHKTSPLLIYHCMQFLSLSLSLSTPKNYSLPGINCSRLFLRLVIASLSLSLSRSLENQCAKAVVLFLFDARRGGQGVSKSYGLDWMDPRLEPKRYSLKTSKYF
jgi:hypothetical protein